MASVAPGNNTVPRLSARNGVVVNEGDDRNAGESGDEPADARPHQQDVGAEFVRGIEEDGGFDLAAEGHQQRGKGHGDERENDQQERDQSLFHKAPDFWKLVAAAEAFHPRDHDAGGGPQRQERGGEQEPYGTLGSAAQEIHRRVAAGGQDPR